jgi:hypothetical protein
VPLSAADRSRRWRRAHPELVAAQKRRYYQKYKERLRDKRREYKRRWRAQNSQRINAQDLIRRQRLSPDQKARKAAYMLKWRGEHRGHIRAYANARHARLRDRHYRQHRARLKRAPQAKRAKLREYKREWIRKWRASNPERNRESKRRYRTKHRARELALRREWSRRPENQTKIKTGYHRWFKSELGRTYIKERYHKRRARKQMVYSLPCLSKIRELRREVRCYWCGGPMNPVSIDHVVALARGGSHTPDNLVAACLRCNSSKREKLPQEWAALTIGQTSNGQ